MPIDPPQTDLKDQRQRDQWARSTKVVPNNDSVTTIIIQDKAVTDAKLRDSAPRSVIGRLAATAGEPGDIQSSGDGLYLAQRGGVLGFLQIGDADLPNTITRDSELALAVTNLTTAYETADAAVSAAYEAADTALEAAILGLTDPFPQYLTEAEGDARYAQIPTILSGSATYDPPSLADGVGVTTTVVCTGAVLGGFARASFSLDLQGIAVTAYVSAADTVSVRFQNESGGTLDLASGTLKVRVDP